MSTSVFELPRFNEPSRIASSHEGESVTHDSPDAVFSTDEMHSLQRDDAMASVAIAIILGCAFLVLLGLTIGVSLWTMTVTG